ncbi:MAG: RNA-directed DNA polymerase (Reverse transcriptase) [Candidatus Cloacimonetes bacterium]|nr:RNA-directed DNA polymerase (Reverse transcriptase) [Candidatus Cloacimonadota bacterium]MDY0366810.1 reverse transcriptase domain-containing protein [Candidatus Syntrophosphaera sp.]
MPKRVGFLYDQLTSWSNLYLAYKKACRHKKRKEETSEWMFNCEKNLFDLQAELKEHRYQPRPYRYFMIREPKERVISVAAFRDRVVHHALVNIIEPIFETIFIKDSYATRKHKGLHLAVSSAQNYAGKHQWYMKLDIEQFFASVDHAILLGLIRRKIKDEEVLSLCATILGNQTESMKGYGTCPGNGARGLPVGNLTSQFFANVYLNKLDHHVKQRLGFSAYVRYMDDFILFSDVAEKLKQALASIDAFLSQYLDLNIKPKSVQINRTQNGIPFLGYRIFPKLLRLRRENLQRCVKGIEKTEKAFMRGVIEAETLYQSTRSRMGFIGFANSNHLARSIWGGNQQADQTV